jgi:hypothetical protein
MGFKFKPKIDLNKLNKELFNTRIYIGYDDSEIHHSGYSAPELARLLSEGDGYMIPPRPHLEEGIEAGMADIKRAIRDYGKSLFGLFPKKDAAQKIANAGRQAVLDYVQSGALTPNAAFTIAKKGSDIPLIETGELLHMLETKIVKGGL